jgi:YVTN family beta-propeller protein
MSAFSRAKSALIEARVLSRRVTYSVTGFSIVLGSLLGSVPASASPAPPTVTKVVVPNQAADVAVDPSTDKIYVVSSRNKAGTNEPISGAVTVIDGKTNKVIGRLGVPPASGVAVDPRTDMIYVLSPYAPTVINKAPSTGLISVINGRTNKITAKVPVGGAVAVGVDATTNRIFVPGGGYTTFVIDGKTNKVIASVPNVIYPNGVAVDAKTDTAFVSGGDGAVGGMWAINGKSNKIPGATVGETPTTVAAIGIAGIAVNSATGAVYVTVSGSAGLTVSAIHRGAKKIASTVTLAAYNLDPAANGIAVDTASGTVYAVAQGGTCSAVYAIDPTAHKIKIAGVLNISIPTEGDGGIAVDSNTDTVYIAAGPSLDVIHGGVSGGSYKCASAGGGGVTLGG